jgi:acetyl esterase/lipase
VPERVVPIPTSVSPEAQAVLAMPHQPSADYPALDDLGAWRTLVKTRDEAIDPLMTGSVADAKVAVHDIDLGEFLVYEVVPEEMAGDPDRVYLDIHGGGFLFGGGELSRATAVRNAVRLRCPVWGVDYRMPPDDPFPAGLDDCLLAYRTALETRSPEQIAVGGASAGGNLAAALVLRARDEGLPLPASAVLMTPAVDLTGSGDSLQTNLGLDPLLSGDGHAAFTLYAGTHDLADPLVSPLYGDFSKGFPPTILTTGTRDLLLSDTVRMHRALRSTGASADLHVQEAGGHGGFLGMAPEDTWVLEEVRRFIERHWTGGRR